MNTTLTVQMHEMVNGGDNECIKYQLTMISSK